MFLRFSKGSYSPRLGYTPKDTFKKCVLLGDSVVMEYGNHIVGIAKLHEETDKCLDYDIIVATKSELPPANIARYIKDMIGKSNKFLLNPSNKRRKYYVEEVDCEVLPIKAEIKFSKNIKDV